MKKIVSMAFAFFSMLGIQAASPERDAYLMVYHKDADHSLHMAVSRDGYTFTAVNNDKAVIGGDSIADQRGIRDPHIFRGPDGAFYIAMTDLHVFAQREGIRDTEWERDGRKYGWGNNRGLVLMKSYDLINWTHARIDFTKLAPIFKEIGCAWAPETCYDDQKKQLMVHFTMRIGTGTNRLYYFYVNDDFNRMTTPPRLLYQAPNGKYSVIDGDITKVGDTYHMFYVSHEHTAGIRHATASRITGPYTATEGYVDAEKVGCEAPNVWKRHGEDRWMLMYDIYRVNPHNFGFVETTDFQTFTPMGRFNEGKMKLTNCVSPKHGSIISITQEEADRLEQFWREKE